MRSQHGNGDRFLVRKVIVISNEVDPPNANGHRSQSPSSPSGLPTLLSSDEILRVQNRAQVSHPAVAIVPRGRQIAHNYIGDFHQVGSSTTQLEQSLDVAGLGRSRIGPAEARAMTARPTKAHRLRAGTLTLPRF